MKLELVQSKYDELVRSWVNDFVEDMEVNQLREYVRAVSYTHLTLPTT